VPTSLTLPLAAHASAAQTERGLRSRGGKAPTDLLHIAGGAKLVMPLPTTLRPGSGEAVPQARGSLGWSRPPHTPRQGKRLALSALRVAAPVLGWCRSRSPRESRPSRPLCGVHRLPYACLGVRVTLDCAVGLPRTVVGSAWGALGLALAVGSGRLPRGPSSGGYEAGLGAHVSEGARLCCGGILLGV